MSNLSMNRRNPVSGGLQAGFTLIEVMVVVVIIAILAAIAFPSYIKQVTKTNRVAAEGCLSEYANYMERYYTTNLRYDQVPASSGTAAGTPNPITTSPATLVLGCAATSQTGTNYTYTVPASSATAYTIQATPIGAQLNRDTQCGSLSLNQAGTRSPTTAGCWQ
jgi:type IV pilus assembly protein PilE